MYEGKDPLIWKLDELEPCKNMEFDMDSEDLRFEIIAETEGNNNCTDPFLEVLESKR